MEDTVSVSKGVFLFKNGVTKKPIQKKKKKSQTLFGNWFKEEIWYTTFKDNWTDTLEKIEDLNMKTYSVLVDEMVKYIKSFYCDDLSDRNIIPSATLLTGVNQPDHMSQFTALISKIRDEVTSHIAMVQSQDAPTVKHLVENVVWQLIHGFDQIDKNDEDMPRKSKVKKSQCTLKTLEKWYNTLTEQNHLSPKKRKQDNSTNTLVIIIPDFESFNSSVLQDFVMILSSYISSLPVVLVFGVATSVSALHKSFPYHVSSKLLIKVFHSHSSPVYMNQVLEEIFLTHTSSFHLTGKAFELLTDVFLFYDFSVAGLIQSIKYCMMDHYYGDNIKSLCCSLHKLQDVISQLSAEDLEDIRRLPSFRPYLGSQDCRTKIKLFENDTYFKQDLHEKMVALHDYMYSFYTCLRLFYSFIKDMPRNALGKSVREIYTKCASENVTQTPEFKECMQLLNFQPQSKLIENLKDAIKILNSALKVNSPIKPLSLTPQKNNVLKENYLALNDETGEKYLKTVKVHLLMFLRQIQNANTESDLKVNENNESIEMDSENTPDSRYKLKEKLLKATRVTKIESEYEMIRSRLVSYLKEMFSKGLRPAHTQTYYEIYYFNDMGGVKKQIVGAPRGAVHTALSNPAYYLQCKCCPLSTNESILSSLPDISLSYKLHLECGKHINLYDWLQAFGAVLQPTDDEDDDERRCLDPVIQSRFTRAVSELRFLGFIKTSKRKTDHVMRLTW